MVAGAGAPDVLLTNEVYGPNAARLAALAAAHPQATIGALVDSLAGVQALDAAAAEAGAMLAAWVEIDAGQGRCGLERGSTEAVAVAKAVLASPALTFGGLQVYHGAIQHLRSVEERRAAVEAGPVDAARRTVEALAAHGTPLVAACRRSYWLVPSVRRALKPRTALVASCPQALSLPW